MDLLVILASMFAVGLAVGHGVGTTQERNHIVEQCERIGGMVLEDKVYECRLKEPPVRPTKGKVML